MKNKNAIAIIALLLIAVVAVLLLMPKGNKEKPTGNNTPAPNPTNGGNNGGTTGGNNVGIAIIENADDILNSISGFIKGIRNNKKANAQTTANISNTNIDASAHSGGIMA